MEEYENLVEIIKKEYSNAKLVIGEILPRYYHEKSFTTEEPTIQILEFCFEFLKSICGST
jgi:hypothetical protein